MLRFMLTTLILPIALTATAVVTEPTYERSAKLNEQGALVEWSQTSSDEVAFKVTSPKTNGKFGWFGFGLTPTGGMRGADIAVGFYDSQGDAVLEDRYAPDKVHPILDAQQDWKLEGATSNDTVVIFRFSRKMHSCDHEHDVVISHDTMRFIYASHPDAPLLTPTGYRLTKHLHESKGLKSLFMFESGHEKPAQLPDEEISYVDFIMQGTQMMPLETIYWNELQKFPTDGSMDGKYMIGFEPVIQPGNEDLVHHMDYFLCNKAINETFPVRRRFEMSDDIERVSSFCTKMIATWAKGGEHIYFPPDVAYPIKSALAEGGWIMLQNHYDNPLLSTTRTDKSGLRLVFSNTKRTHDAGFTSFASNTMDWTTAIPGLQDSWPVRAECPSTCTAKMLPKDGINIVLAQPHTHLLGTKVISRHIRDGKEIEPLVSDENYDFNYQQFRAYKQPRKILPGDAIITECVYSSLSPTTRQNITFGGFGTKEEMCFIYAYYYPVLDLGYCTSQPDPQTLAEAYGWAGTITYDDWPALTEHVRNYNWSEPNLSHIRDYQGGKGKHSVKCFGNPEAGGIIDSISKYEPYVDPLEQRQCTQDAPSSTGRPGGSGSSATNLSLHRFFGVCFMVLVLWMSN